MKAEGIATNPLATARQLWRLNKSGALAIDLGDGYLPGPLSAQDADAAIKRESSRAGTQAALTEL